MTEPAKRTGSSREVVVSSLTSARGQIAVIENRDGAQPIPSILVSVIAKLGHTVSTLDAPSQDESVQFEDQLVPLLELLRQSRPDILFVGDLELPLETVTEAFPWLSVVLFVNPKDLDPAAMLRALHAGVSDILEMPCTPNSVREVIERQQSKSARKRAHENEQIDRHLKELEKDHRAGRYIQMGMLPPNPMAIESYRLRHRIQPSLMLSGDFVDYFRVTDRYFACYVADVSGHGASSAFVTVMLKNFSRRIRREYQQSMLDNPGEILQTLNTELLEQRIDKHIAIWFAMIDLQANRATFVNAGHFPPAILATKQGTRFLELSGRPVGLFPKVEYKHQTVDLAVDDQLIVYSDGMLELLNDATLAEKEARLIEAAKPEFTNFESLWATLGVSDAPGPDDVSCLVVTREA